MPPRRNLVILSLTVVALLTARLTWDRLLPNYYISLGATDTQVGTAFSLFSAVIALFQLAGGLLSDRIGRKPVAVLPILGLVGVFFLMGTARDWRGLLVGHLGLAMLASIQGPGFRSLLAESVTIQERGRAFGVLAVASGIAMAAGPALGAVLLPLVGGRIAVLMVGAGGVAVVVTIVRVLLLRETLDRKEKTAPPQRASHERRWRGAWLLLTGGLFAILVNLLFAGPFITLHAGQALGLEDAQINWLFAAGNTAGILAALAGGWLADRIGPRPTLSLGVALQAGGTLAWALLPPGRLASACFVLATVGGPLASVSYSALLTGVVEGRRRGSFVGLAGTLTGLVGSPAGRVGAELRALAGTTAPFWAALVVAALIPLSLIVGARRQRDGAGTA